MKTEKNMLWLERVEALIQVLEGSSIGELELSEGGLDIAIRRDPGMVLVSTPAVTGVAAAVAGVPSASPRAAKADTTLAVNAPLTGVYYSAASPSTPPFVNVGDVIHAGQVVALVESMKVFNEVVAEISGRVTAIVATSGEVVQKGAAMLRVEPL
ncbi:acetyl-CoA carboxylase biotin carboxyl carrier protein [Ktedonospora formicarum]|uniref:Biotin carboxyl carrier protein of acetyl-CoA carboxylase n=1 Tax=Ktedonospora formicarum TaxID=2778364 RepID=A0A8J3HUG8_9CHLR|nr:biotin/lipoyl-containing protein [Ktedonospora formicarum]GHO44237.1 acetyl-CoA carboxylase, biotin carboxyl carrier protein [Ktedonospora formicarum]